jgi:hypothetical protein
VFGELCCIGDALHSALARLSKFLTVAATDEQVRARFHEGGS